MGKRTFIGKDDDNSDEVRKEPHVGKKLFLGMRFYISRLVKKEEKRELGQLIQVFTTSHVDTVEIYILYHVIEKWRAPVEQILLNCY